ncbi:MAG: hypothetical protein Q7L19_08805 [Pseudohongiella sp.]|nr:hypothetical protein [Pseudohongiella sp.]
MDHINLQLREIYNKYWPGLIEAAAPLNASTIKPSDPLLLSINEEAYKQSNLKIMYCGQETFGWGDPSDDKPVLGKKSVDEVISTYDKYFTQGHYKRNEEGKRVFWRAVKKFNKALLTAFPGQNIYPIWNNISKIGKASGKGMNTKIRELEREFFPVFQEELAVLKPDLIIFMTGPYRDGDIEFNLQKAVFSEVSGGIKERALARVKSDSFRKPALRLYHPAYFGGFHRVFDAAKDEMVAMLTDSAAVPASN